MGQKTLNFLYSTFAYLSPLHCPLVKLNIKIQVIKHWIEWINELKLLSHILTFCNPMDCTYSPWNSPSQNTGVGSLFPSPGGLPNPGIEPRSPTLQVDSFPAEPPGKLRNTGVGSLSLLQQIFSIQELNRGLLHCSRILYQPSYQGSSIHLKTKVVCVFSCFLFQCAWKLLYYVSDSLVWLIIVFIYWACIY